MLKADASPQHALSSHTPRLLGDRTSRSRQRTATSCTECRRRKQKCNQAKPICNNCNRRYPPVECTYTLSRKASRSGGGTLISLDAESPDIEAHEPPFWDSNDYLGPHDPRRYGDSESSSSSNVVSPSGIFVSNTPQAIGGEGRQAVFIRTPLMEVTGPPTSPKGSMSNYSQVTKISKDEQVCSQFSNASQDSYFAIRPARISASPTEPYQVLPLDASQRNLELLHMFVNKLSHYMTSTDGQNSCSAFNGRWVPFMIQSPIFVNVALLTAAYFQAVANGVNVEKSVEVIAARVRLISKINEQLASPMLIVTEDAIAAVMSLAYNELIYADKRSAIGHMRGLREMIRVYGGLENIHFDPLRKMLVRTDYQVACTFECPTFLHDEDLTTPIPALTHYPNWLASPLLESDIGFVDSASTLGLSPECAAMLDDMRFLTTSILTLTSNLAPSTLSPSTISTAPSTELNKFLITAAWIHTRLASLPPSTPSTPSSTDPFLPPILTGSLIFSLAISTRTSLSLACKAPLLQRLWSQMWRVPLAQWKTIPAVFHWLVLTVMPYARDKPEGRFLKGMVAAGMMAVGLVQWDVAHGMMVRMRRVEGWLQEGSIKEKRESRLLGGTLPPGGETEVGIHDRQSDGKEKESDDMDAAEDRKDGASVTGHSSSLAVPGLAIAADDSEDRESVSPRHRTPENVVKV